MKKLLLFLLPIFLLSPAIAFGAYPGDCTVALSNCEFEGTYYEGSFWVSNYSVDFDTCTFSAQNTYVPDGATLYSPTVYCSYQVYYFENDQWLKQCQINFGANDTYGDSVLSFSGAENVTELPPGCTNCDDEYQAKIQECGGEENIVNWTGETGDPDTECIGECTCDGDTAQSAEDYCADKGGLDYYDTEVCRPICNNCDSAAQDMNTQCPCGVWDYDNETCTPDCYDCHDKYYECAVTCSWDIAQFNCQMIDEGGGVCYFSPDVCECGNINPDDPPDDTPPPDEPPDTPTDTTDDSGDGESGSGDTDPDGTNDNALLGDIVDNTRQTADNTKRIGDINQTEFNKVNASLRDIVNQFDGVDSRLDIINGTLRSNYNELDQISDNTASAKSTLQGIYAEIGNINGSVDGIEDGLDTLHGDLDGVEGKLNEISGKLDAEYNEGMLPAENTYDSEIDPGILPEEEDLAAKIADWSANVPFLGAVTGTSMQLTDINACISGTILNQNVEFCFSDYEQYWQIMGAIMIGISGLYSLFIITGRS